MQLCKEVHCIIGKHNKKCITANYNLLPVTLRTYKYLNDSRL